jgi:hypothetical protein
VKHELCNHHYTNEEKYKEASEYQSASLSSRAVFVGAQTLKSRAVKEEM